MPASVIRRTKIVATLGPAWETPSQMDEMLDAGVNTVRINASHGTPEARLEWIGRLRATREQRQSPIGILVDLHGPRIRVGKLHDPMMLTEGQLVTFAPEAQANEGEIPTTYPELAGDVCAGARILLDDGLLEVTVTGVRGDRVDGQVRYGGLLRANKGMNLPGIDVSAPAVTDQDREEALRVTAAGIEYLGVSFVRRAADLESIRAIVPRGVKLVAKIEKDTALKNLDEITEAADVLMVARGDLGVELPFEQVPLAQKKIVQLANLYGRPVITATQMLESMIEHPRPTRAEASDVANALFDGTDAVMLSGETAAGRYPLLAVEAMVRIAGEIEKTQAYEEGPKYDVPITHFLRSGATPTEHAIAAATVEAVGLVDAPAIITFTRTGSTTRLVSSYRPPVPILGVSDQERTWRQLALVWGVQPVRCRDEINYENMLAAARDYLLSNRMAKPGQRVIVTAGVPFHVRGTTNMMRVEEL